MEIFHNTEEIAKLYPDSSVSIGTFDGVHIGHQKIFYELKKRAESKGNPCLLITFDPHPQEVLSPYNAPLILTPIDEKISLLRSSGFSAVLIINFTKAFAFMEPEEFVGNILAQSLRISEIVVGENSRFGHNRRGDLDLLIDLGKKLGFNTFGIPIQYVEEEIISSTRIRSCLISGDLELASRLLGRPYSLRGKVKKGDGKGKTTLGFPTANIEVFGHRKLLPKNGVYAVSVKTLNKEFKGMCNIGFRPTFYEETKGISVEVHILDFSGDLLGETIEINFLTRLRDEIRFNTEKELHNQIIKDKERTRLILLKDI